jgi:phosphate transport system protein
MEGNPMTSDLEQEIRKIRDEIIVLSSMVEKAMMDSSTAMKDHDLNTSGKILRGDLKINKKRFELEGIIIHVIATQQPISHDLRRLTSMLDMCTELERMGDYAKGMAQINLRSEGLQLPKILSDLSYMAEEAVDMLHRAISCFVNEDVEGATGIIGEDNKIDALYRQVYYEAIDIAADYPQKIEWVNYVLWSAHNIERFADRVTNICERTIFVVTGRRTALQPAEFDEMPTVI